MTNPIGVQIYSLREEINNDYAGVLRQLSEKGFLGVELISNLPVSHQESASMLNDLGMQAISAHAPLPIDNDLERALEIAEAYNLKRLVIPYRPVEDFKSIDAIKRTCDILNKACANAEEHGLRLGYHNHWWECESVDGRPAYQIMLEHLDTRIFFEVDTYWALVGGVDPIVMLADLGQRAQLLHVKDGPANREDPMVAVGQGVMDYQAIIAAGEHIAWAIVELDRCGTDMMTAVLNSYDYLVGSGLAHGR